MSISLLTRSLDAQVADESFATLKPSFNIYRKAQGPATSAIWRSPSSLGQMFHGALRGSVESGKVDRRFGPMVAATMSALFRVGAKSFEAEVPLPGIGSLPSGKCDLRVIGGPRFMGVVEVKCILGPLPVSPRGKDLAQLGAYARMTAGHGRFSQIWAGACYVSLSDQDVKLFVYRSSRRLVFRALDVLGKN